MKRSKFNLSNYKLLSCNMGQLIPVGLSEVLPGDSFRQSTSCLIRVSPLVAPVMHPVTVRLHSFFVPNRILWDEWEAFITGGPDGMNTDTPPTFTNTPSVGNLMDYMGIPTGSAITYSKLPIRAYNMIYNEYYRDQDLSAGVTEDSLDIQSCAWEKDYFTSARPWPQKGPDVTLPLGVSAPVRGIGKLTSTFTGASAAFRESNGASDTYAAYSVPDASTNNEFGVREDPENAGYPGIYADLTEATAVDVNQVRLAFALQRYQEARARYGSRYTEYLAYLGVKSSDARLQRPEYLGGGKQTISFSEVLQTAPDTASGSSEDQGVGMLKGHGIAALRSRPWIRFFEEHGYILTLMSVRPRSIYAQGLNKLWSRPTKEDWWQRELQQIGQQEVLKKEIYAQGTAADLETFGYQDRYMEYRGIPSTVSGDFRTTLNYWHMARLFGSMPTLNGSFVTCDPTDRVFADQTAGAQHLWCMVNHNIGARRLVSGSASSRIM